MTLYVAFGNHDYEGSNFLGAFDTYEAAAKVASAAHLEYDFDRTYVLCCELNQSVSYPIMDDENIVWRQVGKLSEL
jgi:hypothetical protein